ncbi:MAG: S46 family peptidase [Cytophagaceae bacterium]
MSKKVFSVLFVLCISFQNLFADEGMWLPLLINKNYEEMERLGIRLTPEEIYSVNNSSLKDAIVNFGGFCTGEIISSEGLIMTNHHCAYESIQSHSSVEKDYLTNGFWAMNRKQELYNEGLSVTFLIRMEDVTEVIKKELGSDFVGRDEKLDELSATLSRQATEGTHYHAEVKSFFNGNQYYLFVYETYTDVRLVGAPPSAIGKFGGDTDNWMWPRHTGDFAFFRVYAGADGKPASYSETNVPLKPRHHLPVSLKGVEKDDFTMVMGYPGSTDRYLPSEGLKMLVNEKNPARIKIRERRLALMKEDMDASESIRIMYSPKYYQVSNYYKYFIGQNQGVKRLNLVSRKQKDEESFMEWVNSNSERKAAYGKIMANYKKIYDANRVVVTPYVYLEEAVFGSDVMLTAYQLIEFNGMLASGASAAVLDSVRLSVREDMADHFKNYNAATEKKILAAMLEMYYTDVDKDFHPEVYQVIEKKYKGNFSRYVEEVFKKSFLVSSDRMNGFLDNPSAKAMEMDKGYQLMLSFLQGFRSKAGALLGSVYASLEEQNRIYTKALLEKNKDRPMYPNANFTMRLTYGTVQDYYPRDAVKYLHITTMEGIMEKEDPDSEEFMVPDRLKELYINKDYGQYGEDGKMPICFITNNDITGGNSGSPVINADGHLIGTAFDGNWEAMSGDIVFEPELQRCIVTDIRYILFVIDKFAGASHLIEEMTLVGVEEEELVAD